MNYVEEEAGGVFGHVMRKGIVERSAITDRLDGRRGRGQPRDMHIRTESQKMGGSNGEGRRHHHGDGDGGRRNMATHGIQRPDRARNLTMTMLRNGDGGLHKAQTKEGRRKRKLRRSGRLKQVY